ncbi:hypothetical protein M153_13010001232 [Pseudoloma neurophilia]|uniref:Uncharacterized protein n=1 Tax=Pseudoloma neurophilia TaxID=146866 RepID=A0A0R0LVB5_9MICR|nr:hypothetical protein M153_13010001232 [Pseudoloma neurophilia]
MTFFIDYVEKYTNSTNEQIILHLRARGLLKTQINCPSCGKSLVEKQVKRNIDGTVVTGRITMSF